MRRGISHTVGGVSVTPATFCHATPGFGTVRCMREPGHPIHADVGGHHGAMTDHGMVEWWTDDDGARRIVAGGADLSMLYLLGVDAGGGDR